MSAQFITIEGSEGGGKTTNLELMKSLLEDAGIPYVVTREPGGTELAEQLRELLLACRDEPVTPQAELLLMFAARSQHVENFIKPELAKGNWVISDRFTDATFAYQGGGRKLSWQLIEELELIAIDGFKPNLTLLLDLDPNIGLGRAAQRGEFDRFEQEEIEFFNRVRSAYLRRMQEDEQRFMLVDASQSLEDVQSSITKQFNAFLKQHR